MTAHIARVRTDASHSAGPAPVGPFRISLCLGGLRSKTQRHGKQPALICLLGELVPARGANRRFPRAWGLCDVGSMSSIAVHLRLSPSARHLQFSLAKPAEFFRSFGVWLCLGEGAFGGRSHRCGRCLCNSCKIPGFHRILHDVPYHESQYSVPQGECRKSHLPTRSTAAPRLLGAGPSLLQLRGFLCTAHHALYKG